MFSGITAFADGGAVIMNQFGQEFRPGDQVTFTSYYCKEEKVCGNAKVIEVFMIWPTVTDFQKPIANVKQNGKTFPVDADYIYKK